MFGQKGGEFEEKTENTGGNMKDCCKGGKDKKEGRGGEGSRVRSGSLWMAVGTK